MAVNRSLDRSLISVAEAHHARIADEGCASHPHLAALLARANPEAARNLADAVHLLCNLHGQHPGLIELVFSRSAGEDRALLSDIAQAFERERLFLVRLTAAVGPMPSTPGSAETAATLMAQRNALEILAASERRGCAAGAACALVGDWRSVRSVLDQAALRVGMEVPAARLPGEDALGTIVEHFSSTVASARAVGFGTEQLLLQHRGLFDLLEARAEAREAI